MRFNDSLRDCQGFDDVLKDLVFPLKILQALLIPLGDYGGFDDVLKDLVRPIKICYILLIP